MMDTSSTVAIVIEELQGRCAQLEQRNAELEQENAELKVKLDWFMEQFRLHKQQQFGVSSERTEGNLEQLLFALFDDQTIELEPVPAEPEEKTITYKRKPGGRRAIMLKDIPVERIEHHLPEEELIHSCGSPLHVVSTQVRQKLEIIPAQAKIIEDVYHIYGCRLCEREGIANPIVTVSMPPVAFPGSLASPSAVAHIMIQKYVDGMPLYRQEQQFGRLGIQLSRQTLANWMIYGADIWLTAIYDRMHDLLLQRDILAADETTLQVLHEPGRKAEANSYMWLYRTGCEAPHIILYEYQETRAGKHPQKFLAGFKGYLLVDGYDGYNAVLNAILCGCWAHARRKFVEALKALPKEQRNAPVAAQKGLEFCNRLYHIEHELKEVTPEERYTGRLEHSRPVLNSFLEWLNLQSAQILPKSTFGRAINYCLGQWNKLEAFLLDGRLEIDNNRSERSIKPFVIGRKNWLFSNAPEGARASATIYSLVETAKENGVNPFHYLKYLFERLPDLHISDKNTLDELLPWSTSLPIYCRMTSGRAGPASGVT